MSGLYAIPHLAIDAFVHMTNKTPTGTYRGPGRYESNFFCERLFDMAANDLGIDPAEFRLQESDPRRDNCRRPLAFMQNLDATWQTELDNGAYGVVWSVACASSAGTRKRKCKGD